MKFNNSVDGAKWVKGNGKGGKTCNAVIFPKEPQPMEHEPYIFERAQRVMDDVITSMKIRNA